MNKKAVLVIMDGYGLAPATASNAIARAKTPNIDALMAQYPSTKLSASGLDVGLPAGQMGNSEVGHTNMGAGRVVFQDLPKISNEIENGDFFKNPAYIKAMDDAVSGSKPLHIMGLMSDGGVHSHITHIFAILDMAKMRGVSSVFVHCFMDGRDVSPTSGADFVAALSQKCRSLGNAKIATVQGRFYAMDRDKRWDRVEKAYDALTLAVGEKTADPVSAIKKSYENGVTDEFLEPMIVSEEGAISSGDSVIFMNFRPDRARELTWALNKPDFDGFARKKTVYPLSYVCTSCYDETLTLPIAYPAETIENTLGDYISACGLRQFRVAETEKYAHVTFFFNGGVERQTQGEERCLVPSPKEFATYDLVPQMSAAKVCDKCAEAIESDKYDLIVCNFANCDMVGHTGNMPAAITAVETVDQCVGKLVEKLKKLENTVLLLTADHGNADCMSNADGSVNTAHTTNLVPLCVTLSGASLLDGGRLSDLAPTILDIMELEKPAEMTGHSLIK